MKREYEIKAERARLDILRLNAIEQREQSKTNCEHDVAHNLVLIYAMQMDKLEWVLEQ